MNFLNNLAIKSKLLVIIIVATIITLFLSFIVLKNLYDKKNSAQNVSINIKTALILANTIDSLQIERGLSAGYLSSKGETNKSAIVEQRKVTDILINDLKNTDSTTINYNSLNELATIRVNIDSIKISTLNAINFYTDAISTLINIYEITSSNTDIISLRNELFSTLNLIKAKETRGQTRATFNALFSSNLAMNEQNIFTIGGLLTTYEIKLNEFYNSATNEVKDFYKSNFDTTIKNQNENYINIAKTNYQKGNYNVSANDWFSSISKEIENLKKVEEFALNQILENSSNIASSSLQNFIILCVVLVIALLTLQLLSRYIVNNLNKSLIQFKDGLNSFFAYLNKENKDVNTINLNSDDEIGEMSKTVNKNIIKTENLIMQDNLLIENVQELVNEVKSGKLNHRITKDTQNDSLQQLKISFNEMLDITSKNVCEDINKITEV